MSEAAPFVSVVLATYNRPVLLQRLLDQLGRQTFSPQQFEVVVVDDGSAEPVKPLLSRRKDPFALRVETQANAGAAAARHRGVLTARGTLLVITDDDMQVADDYLERHVALHPEGTRRVVIGRIRPDPALSQMPFFERWYAEQLQGLSNRLKAGKARLQGNHLYTGNVSMRRADYLAVGGFDPELKRSEDAELGLRLEQLGAEFLFSEDAYVLHGSDHTSAEVWLKRAFNYGIFDQRISRKHPSIVHANPWRFFFRMHPLARPLLGAAALVPGASRPLSKLALVAVQAADKAGLHQLAYAGSSVVYTMEYYRGVRDELGPLTTTVRHFADYSRRRPT